jgi:hypothetical protein
LTNPAPKNISVSVRERLRKVARERNTDFGLILLKYGLERILFRLSRSAYRDVFVLKGALLFELWNGRLVLEQQPAHACSFRFITSASSQEPAALVTQKFYLHYEPIGNFGWVYLVRGNRAGLGFSEPDHVTRT